MCRLFACNRSAFQWLVLGKEDFLSPYLEQLELSNGGHGNGMAALFPSGPETGKGLHLEPEQVTEWFLDSYLAGATDFLFHTRLASVGAISTANCHPFQMGYGKRATVLAHNGHDTMLLSDAGKDGYKACGMPDSHAATFLVQRYGPQVLKRYSGNFLGFHKGKPFCVVGSGFWPLWKLTVGLTDGEIVCSERPEMLQASCYLAERLRDLPKVTYAPPVQEGIWWNSPLDDADWRNWLHAQLEQESQERTKTKRGEV